MKYYGITRKASQGCGQPSTPGYAESIASLHDASEALRRAAALSDAEQREAMRRGDRVPRPIAWRFVDTLMAGTETRHYIERR